MKTFLTLLLVLSVQIVCGADLPVVLKTNKFDTRPPPPKEVRYTFILLDKNGSYSRISNCLAIRPNSTNSWSVYRADGRIWEVSITGGGSAKWEREK